MTQLTAPQLRRHALLIRERITQITNPDQIILIKSITDKFDAQADLLDAKNGVDSGIADNAIIVREYPILGRVETEGGKWKSIEYPFDQKEISALEEKNIHIAWEWSFDIAAELDEGRLYRIYIGTTTDGPRLCWYDGRWRRLHSKNNFGKKYACGGTWSSDKQTFVNINDADPEIATIIKTVLGHL